MAVGKNKKLGKKRKGGNRKVYVDTLHSRSSSSRRGRRRQEQHGAEAGCSRRAACDGPTTATHSARIVAAMRSRPLAALPPLRPSLIESSLCSVCVLFCCAR